MRPTYWHPLKIGGIHWAYKQDIDYNGAACYEIGICRPGGTVHTVYVGHASKLRSRMHSHGIGDNTTRRFMYKCQGNGYEVWFRFYKKRSASSAERLERLLREKWWRYPWNKVGSPWHPTY